MRLSLRKQKLALSLATTLCLAGAAAVVVWAVQAPFAEETDDANVAKAVLGATKPAGEKSKVPTREDFANLWSLPLRRPLYDPPPTAPEVRELPPLGVELLGTIIEPENSMAIVRSAQGVEYKRVGQAVGPAECPASIVEISESAVVLERLAERIMLEVRGQEQLR